MEKEITSETSGCKFSSEIDWLLQMIVYLESLASSDSSSSELFMNPYIVLTLSNSIVMGNLISGEQYLNELNKKIKHDAALDFFKVIGEKFYVDNEKRKVDKMGYIHLKDVTVISNNQKINLKFWRGKLKEIIGFYLGEQME